MGASCVAVGSNVFKPALNNSHVFSPVAMTDQIKHSYEFGPYRIDPAKRLLLRGEESVQLPSKVFETLLVLVQHSEEVVSKDDLLKTVWPDSFVEESNLSQSIFLLRKALGETAQDHHYIVTIPGRGYRFAEKVDEISEETADLVVERHSRAQVTVQETESAPCEGGGASLLRILLQRPWNWMLPTAAGVALLIGSFALFLHRRRPTTLSEADLVLVSDFVNTTGEPVFDGTLKQALTVKLAESPYFNVVPDSQTRSMLSLMGRAASERVVPPIAREVCQRAGAKVVVGGSILNVGDKYTLNLDATKCLTGANLAHQEVEALNKEQVLNNLGNAIPALRRQLGESLGSIQKFDTPIEQATTKSLPALKAYTAGDEKRAQGQEAESIPFYKLAIELDPDFATAYARLAAVYSNVQQFDLADESLRKAFERRERVSESEKFYIASHYYFDTEKDMDKTIETEKLWTEVYPRDLIPFNNLSNAYIIVGQPEKAIEAGQQALRLNPKHASPYVVLAQAYWVGTHFPEAKAICQKAIAEGLDGFSIHRILYNIAFAEGDVEAMQREVLWVKGKPLESVMTYSQASAAGSLGRLRESRGLFESARASARQRGLTEQEVSITNDQAFLEAALGSEREAKELVNRSLQMMPGSARHKAYAALALAQAGDLQRAEELTNEVAKERFLGTMMTTNAVPCIRAAIELHRRNPAGAIEELRRALPYDLASDYGGLTLYYRGLAYLDLKSGKEAAVQFQKILDNHGLVTISENWPLSLLGLARAYAMTGDADKSLAEYREFLELWKNADPDLRILKQAKAEYATLSRRAR
jgi:DNA-binding winged helix-turn-helix (wHTH) protein/tetratricopeptide (TPR) repeat protein